MSQFNFETVEVLCLISKCRLVDNLADLTRYKEAHADLLAEVVALIERNELAEAEAERLGKFNAEV